MTESDFEELTDIRTLIDVHSVSTDDESTDERTGLPRTYKSDSFSDTSKDSTIDSRDFLASPLRPDSRSARFEKIYYVSETDVSEQQREYTEESFEAVSVSERSSLASQTESQLGYSDESWEEENPSSDSEDERAAIAKAFEEEFIQVKLHHLRTSSPRQIQHSAEPVFLKKTKTKQTSAAKQFCKKKLQILRTPEIKPARMAQDYSEPKPKEDKYDSMEIDRRLIERLKLTNIMEKMHKAANIELHDPKKCHICCIAREYNTEQSFIKTKTALAERKAMDLKVEKYLSNHDSITLIGDLAKTLPKPTEDPQQIWQKMMQGIS
ncbi:uncharacterized protein C8orf48 homolog [Ptychodera flava]|uniref:uncharacterized protein C8orf48 homolog n=1 Tax=Ptychodera flava TaxID=63121 RepID=UPI00396AA481